MAERHYLSINTNLESRLVGAFAGEVPASRVPKIVAALHMPERERRNISLDRFVVNFHALRSSGFDVEALYIAWPPLFPRLEADVNALGERDVGPLRVKVFKGFWEGVRYPAAYTDAERALLLRVSGSYGLLRAQPGVHQRSDVLPRAAVLGWSDILQGDGHRRCSPLRLDGGSLREPLRRHVCPPHRGAAVHGATFHGAVAVPRLPGRPAAAAQHGLAVVRGLVSFDNAHIEDFVIMRSTGVPLFILANTVDDADTGITHVIRGEDHTHAR